MKQRINQRYSSREAICKINMGVKKKITSTFVQQDFSNDIHVIERKNCSCILMNNAHLNINNTKGIVLTWYHDCFDLCLDCFVYGTGD